MHQLGGMKRGIEAYENLICGNVEDDYGSVAAAYTNVKSSLYKLSKIAYQYGGYLTRQSDRNFPRTKFGTYILNTAKKSGHEYAGIILNLLVASVSDRGREVLFIERKMEHDRIEDQVYMFELLLGLEEWLRGGEHTYKEIDKLQKAMYDYMDLVKLTCHRKGMGTKLIKYHLLFHLKKYMDLWGPPKGWDSAPSETHHKTEWVAQLDPTRQSGGH